MSFLLLSYITWHSFSLDWGAVEVVETGAFLSRWLKSGVPFRKSSRTCLGTLRAVKLWICKNDGKWFFFLLVQTNQVFTKVVSLFSAWLTFWKSRVYVSRSFKKWKVSWYLILICDDLSVKKSFGGFLHWHHWCKSIMLYFFWKRTDIQEVHEKKIAIFLAGAN